MYIKYKIKRIKSDIRNMNIHLIHLKYFKINYGDEIQTDNINLQLKVALFRNGSNTKRRFNIISVLPFSFGYIT